MPESDKAEGRGRAGSGPKDGTWNGGCCWHVDLGQGGGRRDKLQEADKDQVLGTAVSAAGGTPSHESMSARVRAAFHSGLMSDGLEESQRADRGLNCQQGWA